MSPSLLFPLLATVFAGAVVAMQPALNAQLAGHLGSPLRAALINFTAGGLIMLSIVTVHAMRVGFPTIQSIAKVPPHLWLAGGALGAIFVTTATWATPKIGVGVFFATMIAAQLIAAMLLDHFGVIGLEQRPATLVRIVGAALLIVGAILMARG